MKSQIELRTGLSYAQKMEQEAIAKMRQHGRPEPVQNSKKPGPSILDTVLKIITAPFTVGIGDDEK